jgi:hypothetical protein
MHLVFSNKLVFFQLLSLLHVHSGDLGIGRFVPYKTIYTNTTMESQKVSTVFAR